MSATDANASATGGTPPSTASANAMGPAAVIPSGDAGADDAPAAGVAAHPSTTVATGETATAPVSAQQASGAPANASGQLTQAPAVLPSEPLAANGAPTSSPGTQATATPLAEAVTAPSSPTPSREARTSAPDTPESTQTTGERSGDPNGPGESTLVQGGGSSSGGGPAAGQHSPAPAAGAGTGTTATATPLTPAPAESSSATPARPTGYGVDLQETVENVRATIELAAQHGLTQARIQLEPAELGSIRIHLTQTAAGLLARVSAESEAAGQALAAGHAELRQSLDAIGIDLARLHVSTHGAATSDAGRQGAGEAHRNAQHGNAQHGTPHARDGDAPPTVSGTETTDTEQIEAAGEQPDGETASEHAAYTPGALVDVLA